MMNKQTNNIKQADLSEGTDFAYSIVRDPSDQKYVLFELRFNPKTKTVDSVKEICRDIYFREVEDQFKVCVAENVFEKVRL